MAVFPKRRYTPSSAGSNTLGAWYRARLSKQPFLMFGLPFLSVIVAASFVLTPATAIRYERYDRKVRQLSREEELGVGKGGRKVDIREEYYVRLPCLLPLVLLGFRVYLAVVRGW
jgi:cytochrome c oxidase assembly protein subunit 16